MKPKLAIYLAGSIKKGHENPNETFWTDEDINLLKEHLDLYEVAFLNPAFRSDDLSDQRSVFGRDMLQVFCSHVVFVDARDRRGLGVGAEMMWAKLNKIPVVTLAPKDSHYHKKQTTILGVIVNDFIHPFVESLSDKIVENLAEGAHWIERMISNPTSVKIKGMEHINAAMEYYKESQLYRDAPMKQLSISDDELSKRMHRTHPQFAGSGEIFT
jgi:hypothetical protein